MKAILIMIVHGMETLNFLCVQINWLEVQAPKEVILATTLEEGVGRQTGLVHSLYLVIFSDWSGDLGDPLNPSILLHCTVKCQ